MTASPLTKVWAFAFEGRLLAPLEQLALKNMEFSINSQCLLKSGTPIIIVHKQFHKQLSQLINISQQVGLTLERTLRRYAR